MQSIESIVYLFSILRFHQDGFIILYAYNNIIITKSQRNLSDVNDYLKKSHDHKYWSFTISDIE